MILTHNEMLSRWMLHCGYEPLRADATVVRADGIDLERLMGQQMRSWYLDLLDTAPREMLVTENVALTLTVESRPDGSALITLPEDCRRIFSIRLEGWTREAQITTPDTPLGRRQANPLLRAGCDSPVAVDNGRQWRLYSPPPSRPVVVADAIGVMRPEAGVYRLDERALSLIPDVEQITSHLP